MGYRRSVLAVLLAATSFASTSCGGGSGDLARPVDVAASMCSELML
jgi:hypothetical protein